MQRRQRVQRSLVVLAASIFLLSTPIPLVWAIDGTVETIQYNPQRKALQINNSGPVEASINTVSMNGTQRIILDIQNAEIGTTIPKDTDLLKALSTQLPAIQNISINQFGGSRPVVRVLLDLKGEGSEVQLVKANGPQLELRIGSRAKETAETTVSASSSGAKHPSTEISNLDQAKKTIATQQQIIIKLEEKLTEAINKPAQGAVQTYNTTPFVDEMKRTLVAVTQKYNDMVKENQKLRQQVESSDPTGQKLVELKKLRDTNQTLQNETVKLSQENMRLKQQAPDASAETAEDTATVKGQLEAAKKELANAIEVINRQNKEISNLKDHMERTQLQVDASARNQVTLLNTKLEEKEAQLKAIQQSGQMIPSVKTAQQPSPEVQRLQAQLKQKDTQIIALTQQLSKAMEKPAAAPAENTAPSPAIQKALTEKEAKITVLSKEIETLKQKLAAQVQEKQLLEKQPTEKAAASEADIQRLTAQLKERDEQITALSQALEKAKATAPQQEVPSPNNGNEITYDDLKKTLVILNKKYEQLKTENSQLRNTQQSPEALQKLTAQLKEKDDQVLALVKQQQQLRAKLDADKANPDVIRYNDLQNTLALLNKKNEALKNENEQLKKSTQAQVQPPKTDDTALKQLQSQNEGLQAKLTELTLQVKEKDEALQGLTKEQEQLRTKLEADKTHTEQLLTKKNDALLAENEQLKKSLQAPQQDTVALQQLQENNTALQAKIATLSTQYKGASTEAQQLKALQADQTKVENTKSAEVKTLLTERAQLMKDLAGQQEQVKTLQGKLAQKGSEPPEIVAQLQQQLSASQQLTQKLQGDLAQKTQALQLSQQSGDQKLLALKDKYDGMLRENQQLQAEISTLQAKKPDTAPLQALQQEKEQLVQTMATLQTQWTDLNGKYTTALKETAQLKEKLAVLQQAPKPSITKEPTFIALQQEKDKLAQQLQEANRHLKEIQNKQETLNIAATATADLLREKQDLLRKIQEQQVQLMSLPALKDENQRLTARFEAQLKKATELQAQADKGKSADNTQTSDLEKKLRVALAEASQLREKLNTASPADPSQSPEYRKLRQQKEELASELSDLQGQVKDLQEQLKRKETKGRAAFAEAPQGQNGSKQQAENYYAEAKKLDNDGDLASAIEGYQKAYALSPENPQYVFALTTTMMALKNYPEATRLLQQFLAKDPQNRDAYNQLGKAYLLSGKPDEAQASFAKAVHISALSNYATTLKKLGKTADAERVLKVALSLSPKDSDLFFNLGNLYNSSNNLPAAQTAYEQAVSTKPDFAEAHYNLGLVYSKTGDKQNAITHLEKYLELSPEANNYASVASYVKKLKGS